MTPQQRKALQQAKLAGVLEEAVGRAVEFETFYRRMHDWHGGRDWETLPHSDEECITCREWRAAGMDPVSPPPDRDDQIRRIAAVLRMEAVGYALHAYSHPIEAQAAALYDAGLRATPRSR